jgi:NADPH:quinone reductase-like Zn-dependent oxidoreductase
MKASVRNKYGLPNPIKIEQIEKPTPNENEVFIKVYNTSVNRTDCLKLNANSMLMRFFLGLLKSKKKILGTDFAGEVISTGKNITSYNVGDKVFGFNATGLESQAEYCTATIPNVYPIPYNIDFKSAAASLEGAHYAYSSLYKVNIEEGAKVLINGASGGIGSALLQFVRQNNIHITVTCCSKNLSLMKTLGADKVIDYTKEDFTQGEDKFDYIFDTVGKSTFRKCKSSLNKKGAYISSNYGPYLQNIFYPLFSLMSRKKMIFSASLNKQQTIPYIHDLLERKIFTPVIDREYAMKDISKAYEYVLRGKKTGNVLINYNQ